MKEKLDKIIKNCTKTTKHKFKSNLIWIWKQNLYGRLYSISKYLYFMVIDFKEVLQLFDLKRIYIYIYNKSWKYQWCKLIILNLRVFLRFKTKTPVTKKWWETNFSRQTMFSLLVPKTIILILNYIIKRYVRQAKIIIV